MIPSSRILKDQAEIVPINEALYAANAQEGPMTTVWICFDANRLATSIISGVRDAKTFRLMVQAE
jgi:hypothetical protein